MLSRLMTSSVPLKMTAIVFDSIDDVITGSVASLGDF
jgi:hypothetical protein